MYEVRFLFDADCWLAIFQRAKKERAVEGRTRTRTYCARAHVLAVLYGTDNVQITDIQDYMYITCTCICLVCLGCLSVMHMYFHVINSFPQAVCFLPKDVCDVRQVEIARAIRLCKTTVEPIFIKVPRTRVSWPLLFSSVCMTVAFSLYRWSSSRTTSIPILE